METTSRCYEVPAYRLDALCAKVARLARRSQKLGCPLVTLEVVGEAQRKILRAHGRPAWIVDIAVIEVTGPAPRIQGWTFAGVLEHLQGDDGALVNILRTLVDGVPERYRDCPPACDHCRTVRRRNDTYVVRSDAGEWKQIGRQCLVDFTGHDSAQELAAAAEWIEILDAVCADFTYDDEGGFGGGGRGAWPLRLFLAHTYEVMAVKGWVSRKKTEEEDRSATADLALMAVDPPLDLPYARPSDAAFARADAAIEWLADLDPSSDFEWNISAVGRVGTVTHHLAGIAAAIACAHERALGRMAERAAAAAESNYFGEVGKRARFTLRVMRRHTYDTEYGAKTAVIFRDEAGNVAVWRATGVLVLDVGHRYEVKATVKAHEIQGQRKGIVDTRPASEPLVKQTVLTRVTVEADLGNPDATALEEDRATQGAEVKS